MSKSIREWQSEIHQLAVSKGWYDNNDNATDPTWLGARLALVHSEVSEALEDVRKGGEMLGQRYAGLKPVGLPSELADIIIRVLDLAGSLGIDLEQAIELKHGYNATRPHRHGGKTL